MLRTSGLELTTAVNSDSSWKVLKGNRSSSRRVVTKVSDRSTELVCVNSRSYNMPISQSEKHQGNVLDCNKLENLPIKKRRFLLRPPSPPPKIHSPVNEENPDFNKCQDDLVQSSVGCPVLSKSELDAMSMDGEDVQGSYPNKVNETIKCSEDFSGISMLAAAACSSISEKEFGYADDGSGIEEPSVREGPAEVSTNSEAQSLSEGLVAERCVTTSDIFIGVTSSCVSTALAGELAATSTADCTSEKMENIEKSIKEPLHEDGTPTVSSDVSSMRDEDVVGSQNLQCRDHRLHWDLNVVMDAWDQPVHDQNAHTSDHIYEGSGNVASCDANRSAEDHDLRKELQSSICEVEKKLLQYEPKKLLDQLSQTNAKFQVDDCNHKYRSASMCDMSVKSECKDVVRSLVNANISVQPMQCKYVNKTLPVLKHADNERTGDVVAPLFTDQSNLCDTSISVIDTQVRLTCRPIHDTDNELTLKSMMSDKPFDGRRQSLKDDENNDATLKKVKKENDHPQSSSCLQEFTVRSGTKANNGELFMNDSEQVEVDFHLRSDVKVKMASDEHFEEKFISDIAADPCSAHETEAAGKLQDDNDSQYEDGELREPVGHVWEEYDAVNDKTEHVDYVCGNSRHTVTAADHHDSEMGLIRRMKHKDADLICSPSGVANEHGPESHRLIADDNDYGNDENLLNLVHSGDEKMNCPVSSVMLESNKLSSATAVTVRDDCEGKGRFYNFATRPPDPDGTDTRIGSRLYGRGLPSQIEGPVGHDMPFREDQTVNRWDRRSSYMKSSESVRYSMQSQPRTHPVNSWHGSSDVRRGIKRNYSPTFHTHLKLDEGDDTVAKEGRDSTLNTAPYLSHPPTNDESITDVGTTGNFQPNHKLHGGLGPDRSTNRGRFYRYGRQMDHGAAGRGRYHVHSPDDSFQSPLKFRRPLSQRDRSFSPNERSRSPDPRVFPRVRSAADPRDSPRGRTAAGDYGGPYVRHKSRSPNFRSEARMPRMRSPPNHQRFGSDRMNCFRPFPRDHGSPPSSRWISNRKDELDHLTYKQRPMLDESPNRIRLRGDRTDHLDFARNPKPDVCYRHNTGRFNHMEATGRPHRLEGNFENRRRQFGQVNSARRGYEDGIAKRIHHGDDDFVSMNRDAAEFHGRGNRDIDNRNGDIPRKKFRRDATFMYERGDGKFGSNSKQFGYGKSAEPYRSVNPGRFNEMDGAGRGQRYVDRHDERRRPYGNAYLPRRGEMEGMGSRPSHDDDLPVPQSSCIDDVTDSHGRNPRGMDDIPTRHTEEHLDLTGQEKKVGEISKSTDVEGPAEK